MSCGKPVGWDFPAAGHRRAHVHLQPLTAPKQQAKLPPVLKNLAEHLASRASTQDLLLLTGTEYPDKERSPGWECETPAAQPVSQTCCYPQLGTGDPKTVLLQIQRAET